MNLGDAITALMAGEKVGMDGWKEKGMFLYFVSEGAYPARTAIAKAEWGEDALVPYQAYIAMKTEQGTVMPWTPSMADMLTKEWMVL